MEWLKAFSSNYANAVTAVAATLALLLTALTLITLRREYRAKYRPYIIPLVAIEEFENEPGQTAYGTSIRPQNVGPHPCLIRISDVLLKIGDEQHETKSMTEWTLVGTHSASVAFPSGHINSLGIKQIREHFYQVNRVEVHFTFHSKSIDNEHEETKRYVFEIEMRGASPTVMYRPDLISPTV